MFEAASESFVKAIGSETLIPITSIDRADNCQPLHVVVKQKRYWIWQTPKYQPTSFSLQEILTESSKDMGVGTSSHGFLSYSRNSKFSASGRLGIKIAKELVDVEVSGEDMVELVADLGRMDKVEAEADDISDALQERFVNLSHDLVEEVRRDARKCLCVVVATAVTTKDANISSIKETKGTAEVDVKPYVHPEANIGDKSSNKLVLPKGTAIAYSVRDLLIQPDGGVKVVLLEGEEGGFVSVEDSREESKAEMNLDLPVQELFQPLTSLEASDRRQFQYAVLQVASHASVVPKLLSTMKHAHFALQRGANDETVPATDLEEHLSCMDSEGWQTILQQAGFGFGDEKIIRFPTSKSPSFVAVWALLQAMEEMSDEQLLGLEGITSEYAAPLLYAMQLGLKNQNVEKKSKKVALLFMDDNLSAKFLDTLCVVEGAVGSKAAGNEDAAADAGGGDASADAAAAEEGILHPPINWKVKLELEAAFRVVFALHGGDEDVKDLLSPDDCCKTKCSIL